LHKVGSELHGCTWNVQLEWENGEIKIEPLNFIFVDDPVTCVI